MIRVSAGSITIRITVNLHHSEWTFYFSSFDWKIKEKYFNHFRTPSNELPITTVNLISHIYIQFYIIVEKKRKKWKLMRLLTSDRQETSDKWQFWLWNDFKFTFTLHRNRIKSHTNECHLFNETRHINPNEIDKTSPTNQQ